MRDFKAFSEPSSLKNIAKVLLFCEDEIQKIPHVPVWGKWGIYLVFLVEVLGGSLPKVFLFFFYLSPFLV